MNTRFIASVVLVALLVLPASSSASTVLRPPMRHQKLTFWPKRVAHAKEWSRFMYGTDKFDPELIVEHWTLSDTQESAVDFWNRSSESTWVHFIIDLDGTITQLAPLDALAKQAYGVSPWAIGVEHVGISDGEVMANRRMRRASYRLTCWLQDRLDIPLSGVIGHAEAPLDEHFGFTKAGWNWIESTGYVFHDDFSHQTMVKYRARLRRKCA